MKFFWEVGVVPGTSRQVRIYEFFKGYIHRSDAINVWLDL